MSGVRCRVPGMTVNSYRDLRVWQKAMELVVASYELTKQFPPSELYAWSARFIELPFRFLRTSQKDTVGNTSATICTICRLPTDR